MLSRYSTWLEINRSAFHHNNAYLSRIVAQKGGTCGLVVKANAYGHGLAEIALLAREAGFSWLYAGNNNDARMLRDHDFSGDILVFTPSGDGLDELVRKKISLSLFNVSQLALFSACAKKTAMPLRVHIKIDTGLSRLGFLPHEMSALRQQLLRHPEIVVEGLFTHLAATEELSSVFARHQLAIFERVVAEHRSYFSSLCHIHALASGGIHLLSHTYPQVRSGTSVYGFYKSSQHRQRLDALDASIGLQPVLSWKGRIAGVFQYNGALCARVPVGYYHGYPTALANKAVMLLQGKIPLLVHDVLAEEIMLKVSPNIAFRGDEILILGGTGPVSAGALAEKIGTIDRDIISSISPLIPRIITD